MPTYESSPLRLDVRNQAALVAAEVLEPGENMLHLDRSK
jgi:hypothetical protein